ncbi:transcriptional regulator, GntR family [Agromyces sp. CF514]|uniref:GntR family transcriptional regulator n=1 Tax=Agromyces sp. CF514 TaxID=1881031 RepID=UPI0008F276AE|nr:GntR family transcriptional regulator [Agromyces sp. CF514]SFR91891.1 transcriptional regulator, GntR family [Agromyces sp. CF514]
MVYKLIADDLRERIASGQLAPGDDVPTEAELAELWRTSRGPIRNALAALRHEGLIETTRGRPAKVVERKAHQAVDVSIPFTRWARDLGAAPGAITQEVSLRRADPEHAEALDVDPGTLVVHVLRLRLLDGRPTMLERLTYIEPVGRVLFGIDLDAVSITEVLAEHGLGSSDVDHEIDAIAADELDASLLGLAVGAPVLRLRRVSRDDDGRVFEASDDRYRSDLVRFTVAASGRAPRGEHYLRPIGG